MKSLKITTTIVLAAGFAVGIGCGSDSGNKPDTAIITTGTGGAVVGVDAGVGGAMGTGGIMGMGGMMGTGGAMVIDASGAGGAGGSIDANIPDLPVVTMDGGPADVPMSGPEVGMDTGGGEVAAATNICTGLTPDQCDVAIRNAAVAPTVVAQDVPVLSATTYPACAQ